ncbi:cation transport protein-domain-containing protein [Morchella snyderi]|nr:cation transport protein-domain-containing protein [Morchella snyderi]
MELAPTRCIYWQYIYYFVLYLVSSLAFLIAGLGNEENVGYLNALFLCISAGTGAGLNTVNLSSLNSCQQAILWLDIIMGSHMFLFAGLVITLQFRYKKRSKPRIPDSSPPNIDVEETSDDSTAIVADPNQEISVKPNGQTSIASTVLEHQERYELSARHQAFVILSWVVLFYIIVVQLLAAVALGWYISSRHPAVPAENHVNAWWAGAFLSISAFNNSGMSLIDSNMAPFQRSYFVLLVMTALILLGNTIFPILLRGILRVLERVAPKTENWEDMRDGLEILASEKARMLCPYLFSGSQLAWLGGTIIIFNGIDWAVFGISSVTNPAFKDFSVPVRVVDGLFQALAVRSGGFGVVDIPSLKICVQITYLVMMYISSFPICVASSYEGGYRPDPESAGKVRPRSQESRRQFLRRQIRRTFTVDDFWMLFFIIWVIATIETPHFDADPVSYSIFNITFEVISAYGCVGVSMGHPDMSTSMSGALRGGSQLVLCIVMLLGRTREARKGVWRGDWGIGSDPEECGRMRED